MDVRINILTIWLVEAMIQAGRSEPRYLSQAKLMFETMLGNAKHLGPYAEKTGHNGEALANFLQVLPIWP